MRRYITFILSMAMIAISGLAAAEPPTRAARLGFIAGAVSLSPAGENDWVQATLNRPLTSGDRIWADADSRAEVQVGGAALRLGGSTSVALLNLNDSIAQVQLAQGALKIRVRRLRPGQAFEVDTPNLAFTLRQPGDYRIEVDPLGDATTVRVESGQGEVYGDGASYMVDSRQGYRFTGTGLRDFQPIAANLDDGLDRWARGRDRRSDYSESARYVSSDVVGYEDLDRNGTWRIEPAYGSVWVPNRVAVGWTPYHDGHWAWVDPWGWTWVDDEPWGYAVSHYGRWADLGGTWGWVPGPVAAHAVYAPALVAFLGGSNFPISQSLGRGGAVGWFPLAPRDVYVPSYDVSPDYFHNINRSNTVINTITLTNIYNTTIVNKTLTKLVYANQVVPGAVVAVPTAAFVRAQPVAKSTVWVSKDAIVNAPVSGIAEAVPVSRSVHGGSAPGARPPVSERPIVVRSTPPAVPLGLAAQQQQLAAVPGKPLDTAARKFLKPVATMAAPQVKVVPTQAGPPTAPPPAAVRLNSRGGSFDQANIPIAPPASGTMGASQERLVSRVTPLQLVPSTSSSLPVPIAQAPQRPASLVPRDQPVKSPPPAPVVRSSSVAAPPIASSPVQFVQAPRQAVTTGQGGQSMQSVAPRQDMRTQGASQPLASQGRPFVQSAPAPQQPVKSEQRDQSMTQTAPPQIARPPVTLPPLASPQGRPPVQSAHASHQSAQPVAQASPAPIRQPVQVARAPVAPPPLAPAPHQSAKPVSPQASPALIRPPPPVAHPSPQPQPSRAAQQPAPKPAHEENRSAQHKKA